MMPNLTAFLQGVAATAAWINGVFFWKFWRQSGDRLFANFAVAFWVLGLSWALLAVSSPEEESRPYIYALRLVAFLLMIVAIADKNRDRQRRT
jgi:hypothetical protein